MNTLTASASTKEENKGKINPDFKVGDTVTLSEGYDDEQKVEILSIGVRGYSANVITKDGVKWSVCAALLS